MIIPHIQLLICFIISGKLSLDYLLCFIYKVKEETLIEALTKKKTMAGGETVVISYKLADVSFYVTQYLLPFICSSLRCTVYPGV